MSTSRGKEPADAIDLALAHGREVAHRAVQARRAARRGTRRGPSPGLLVAEGDSWFDYPLHDVLERLENRHGWRVLSAAHKGDTVEAMAYDPLQAERLAGLFEQLALERKKPRAILISGGGNDVVGDEFAVLLNHKASRLPTLNDRVVAGILEDRIEFALVSVISAATELARRYLERTVPVLVHGYDYPVPDGRGFLGGFWFLPGPWIEPGFRRKGYADAEERLAVLRDLMDRHNRRLAALPGRPGLEHVVYLDLRGTLPTDAKRYRQWWDNELHPTPKGFERIAGRFDRALRALP